MLDSTGSARAPIPESSANAASRVDHTTGTEAGGLSGTSKHHPIDPVAIVTGGLSVALGLTSLVLTLLALATSLIGMAFAAMLNFVALGLGFLTMGLGWRLLPRLLLGTVALIDVVLTIIYLTYETGVDAMIVIRIFPETNIPVYAMNPNGSVACALVAAALLLLMAERRFRGRLIVIFLFGSVIISLGLLGFAGHLIGLQTTFGVARFTGITFPVAAGLVLLGTGVLTISWRQSLHVPTERHVWVLVVVGITGVVVTTSLWQAVSLLPTLSIQSTQQFRSYLARTVLIFVLLATAVLAVAVSLAQKFRRVNEDLDDRVQHQTAELQAANKELEAFSYSVSHDLRAPLRHLSGFSELLLQESSNNLNETSRHYLDEIRDAASRMRQLVDDLLDFSRMSRQDLRCRMVALNSVVNEVIHELSPEIIGRQIEWQIAALPEVQGDPILLKQVFANLLFNAVKFTRSRNPAIIAVGEMLVKGKRTIFVRDNGVGFNMRYAEKLFGVFQRLHRSDEFEGTGIGLATVQRIVYRHGGNVWAESELGQGATFYFTLDLSRRIIPGTRSEQASATTPQNRATERISPPAKNGPPPPAASEVSECQSAPSAQRKLDLVAVATGTLGVVLGVTFLGFASSLRGSLSTHFSLAAMGCAFLAMGLNWPMVARMVAIPIGLLNLITFICYVKFGPPGLDTVIIEWLWPATPKSFSGDLNADLGYAMTALAILLLTESGWRFRWRTTAIVLAGSAVVGLGCVGLAGYLTGLRTAYGLHRLIEVSFNSIIGTLILGAGLLVISWRQGRHIPAEQQSWTLMVIAVTGFVVSTSLWQALMLVHKLPIESPQHFRSYLANTVLVFGLLATAVLSIATSLVWRLRNLNEQLDRLIHQQTSELQAANKELEAFTYSVSHDLRAPLRHLGGFAALLLEESGNTLNETSRHYVDEIRDAADRMRQLVNDLLDFSRMSRQDLHRGTVSLNAILSEVTRELSQETKERNVEWQIATLPEVHGDPILLKQVFANLLSNAVKFTRPRDLAVIEIGKAMVNGEQTIFVRDNGVGFNMRYAEKLFGVFQRLHRSDEFEGTGIGLATVQRIIHRHGGHVWAQSEVGKGATFYFTLGFFGPQPSQEAHYESTVAH